MSASAPPALIVAAGGIVRAPDGSGRIAVIRRELYGDEWALPKGKQEAGEPLEETARREVREETGHDAEIRGFAGVTQYFHGAAPKIVVFFVMQAMPGGRFRPSAEVRELCWLTPAEALTQLSHAEEARLVRQLCAEPVTGRK